MKNSGRRLGELLQEAGIITSDQLDRVLNIQKKTEEKIGEILLAEGFVEEKQIPDFRR